MSETALARRHRLARVLKEELGADYRPGRKTTRRRQRRLPDKIYPYRVTVLLPERWLVSPGASGVIGVSVEPDPISGPLAVIEHRDLEWACRQLATFLLAIASDERILTANVERDGVTTTQQIVLTPEGALMPRGTKPTWQVPA